MNERPSAADVDAEELRLHLAGGGRPPCATCLYWTRGPRAFGDYRRECRRAAPVRALLINGDTRPEWPETDRRDWCGEHPDFAAWLAARRAHGDST